MQYVFSFENFQKMLKENNGKPIVEKIYNGFKLHYTVYGTDYSTMITNDEIIAGYKKEFAVDGVSLEKAIGNFSERYLKDCYEHLPNQTQAADVKTTGDVQLREAETPQTEWKYKANDVVDNFERGSLSILTMETGEKVIKGKKLSGEIAILGRLEKG